MTKETESLITFPCHFTIKIFGAGSDTFKEAVLTILHQHVPDLSPDAIRSRHSENGKYLVLSVTLPVDSKKQLDAIYQALSSSPHVLMTL